MGYFRHMLPDLGLANRLFREQSLNTIYFHAKNNFKNNLFNLSSEPEGLIIPNSIYIEPTMRCSRRCTGCYPDNLGEKPTIEERTAHHVFDTAQELGVHYIAWIGGEPLFPDVRSMTLDVSAEHKDVAVVLCTNADHLDEKTADRLADMHNTASFLSIDGFRDTNDRRRGKGSYDNVTKAMGYLKERKAMIGHSSTIMSSNYNEVTSERFLDEMIDRGSLVGTYLLFISNKDPGLRPTPREFAQAILNLNEYGRTKPLYFLSAEYGRLKGNKVMRGKRLIALTIDPLGGVRTERGGKPIARIGDNNSLIDIIKSDAVQEIFKKKIAGKDDRPDDGMRKELSDAARQLINESLR